MNKYELIEFDKMQVTADISMLDSGDIYLNATEIAKQFGKKPNEWLNSKQAKNYIGLILKTENFRFENLVKTVRGGKYPGTWVHKKLALPFARWLSIKFEYQLDLWIDRRIADEQSRKLHRQELRTGYLPLTNAVLADHLQPKHYHFSNECDLINKLVTGMTAKQFKLTHCVDNVRDALTANELVLMEKLQRQNTSLIELGFPYDERKTRLQSHVAKLVIEAHGSSHG